MMSAATRRSVPISTNYPVYGMPREVSVSNPELTGMLHGTERVFEEFRVPSRFKPSMQYGFGIHFTRDRELASLHGDKIVVATIHYNKLLDTTQAHPRGSAGFLLALEILESSRYWKNMDQATKRRQEEGLDALIPDLNAVTPRRAIELLHKYGYDAVKYIAKVGSGTVHGWLYKKKAEAYVVLDPSQVTINKVSNPAHGGCLYLLANPQWSNSAFYFDPKRGKLIEGSDHAQIEKKLGYENDADAVYRGKLIRVGAYINKGGKHSEAYLFMDRVSTGRQRAVAAIRAIDSKFPGVDWQELSLEGEDGFYRASSISELLMKVASGRPTHPNPSPSSSDVYRMASRQPYFRRYLWDVNKPEMRRGRRMQSAQWSAYVAEYQGILKELETASPERRTTLAYKKLDLEKYFSRRRNPERNPEAWTIMMWDPIKRALIGMDGDWQTHRELSKSIGFRSTDSAVRKGYVRIGLEKYGTRLFMQTRDLRKDVTKISEVIREMEKMGLLGEVESVVIDDAKGGEVYAYSVREALISLHTRFGSA